MKRKSNLCTLRLVSAIGAIAIAAGCDQQSADQSERISSLEKSLSDTQAKAASAQANLTKSEEARKALEKQVEQLKITPGQLLQQLTAYASKNETRQAEEVAKNLEERFPQSREHTASIAEIKSMRARVADKVAQDKRVAEQGFRALQPKDWRSEALSISIGKTGFSNEFIFDRYGDRWHLYTADRGHRYITLPISVTAAKGVSNPPLPEFGVYYADGELLRRIAKMTTRFARWEDYATYLGNYTDTRNDFAKTATIPFALGAEASNEELNKRPLYIVSTADGCLRRHYARFDNPPVSYSGDCNGLDSSLEIKDFLKATSRVKLVRRVD